MTVSLAPIAEIIRVKRRPETTLSLTPALEQPEQTVADYVFTDAIRDHFHRILRAVQDGRGQGFWVQGEYGGGKTHFLATLAGLLGGNQGIWDRVTDPEIRNFAASLAQSRLFPVVFSLRGQGSAGGVERRLYDVLEEQIEAAAAARLGRRIALNSADELIDWYRGSGPGTRDDIDHWLAAERGGGLEALVQQAGRDDAAGALRAATTALKLRPSVAGSTVERLRRAYRTIVQESGDYSGLLVVIDEFAFWQELHPEGSPAYAHDEEVLETLAWVLRRDFELPIYTVVASQKPPPIKLSGQQGGRFEVLDVLRGETPEAKVRDYQRIVSHRVREITPDRRPEVNDYAQYYQDVFGARFNDRDAFVDAFPIERHAYEILQLLTQSMASQRVGINVIWEVLGRESGDAERPALSEHIADLRRLVIAADLLHSPTLADELTRAGFTSAVRARDAVLRSLDRLDLAEERPLAETITQTLFLWYLAHQQAPRPMTLQELAEASLLEADIYGTPKDAALAIAGSLAQLSQIEMDVEREEIAFKVTATEGPDPATLFLDFQRRAWEPVYLDRIWRDALCATDLQVEGTGAAFTGSTPDQPATAEAEQAKVIYRGEYTVASEWAARLGDPLMDRSKHWRVVYLQEPRQIGAEQLHDPRIAVVVPAERSEAQNEALRAYAAYRQMASDMGQRTDPEALVCQSWLRDPAQRRRFIEPLLRAQREVYRAGEVVTRDQIGVDPRQLFSANDSEPRRAIALASQLLGEAFRDRPFPAPTAPQAIKGAVFSQLFNGYFGQEPVPAAVRDARKNYGPALGLAKADRTDRLDAAGSAVFTVLREQRDRAQAEGRSGVPAHEIYDALWRRGVPEDLTTIFLLAFVYTTSEGAELTLKREARVKLGSGGRLSGERITAALVRQLDFGSLDAKALDMLAPRQGVTWDAALPLLQQLDSSLTLMNDPERIAESERRLTARVDDEAGNTRVALEAIQSLSERLGSPLPPAVRERVQAIDALAGADGYQELYDRIHERFEGDRERLAEAITPAATCWSCATRRSTCRPPTNTSTARRWSGCRRACAMRRPCSSSGSVPTT